MYVCTDDFFPPDLDFGLFYQTDPDLVECQSSFSGQTDPFARIPTLRMRPTDGAIQSGTKIQIAPIPPSQPVLPEPNKNARRPIGKRTPGMKGIKSEAKGDSSMRSSVGYNGDKSDDEEFEEEGDDEEDGFEYNNTSKKSKRGVRHEDFAPPDPNDLDEVQRVERRYEAN